MFLLDRKVLSPSGSGGGRSEEFAVLGATANGEFVKSAFTLLMCPLMALRIPVTDVNGIPTWWGNALPEATPLTLPKPT